MTDTAGSAPDASALRTHAANLRALGEHRTADLAARTRALAVEDRSFGDAAVLSRLPKAYTAIREEVADRIGRATEASLTAADTLDGLAARDRQADEDGPPRPGGVGR